MAKNKEKAKQTWKCIGITACVLAFIIFLSLIITPMFGWVESSDSDEPITPSASVSNLNVVATIDRDRNINVTETFSMTFLKDHLTEAIRYVPYAGFEYRTVDGKTQRRATYNHIDNITGTGVHGEKLRLYYDELTGYITIGLKSNTFIPKDEIRDYTISYTYELANDANTGFDDLYFNIVGTDSLAEINNVTFSVTLPSVSDAKDIKIYTGTKGVDEKVDVVVSGDTITGSMEQLKAFQGITMRAVYEDGYFHIRTIKVNGLLIAGLVLAIFAIVLAIFAVMMYTQHRSYPKPVEVTAPDNISPATAEGIYRSVTNKSIAATIVYLASHGYIKIVQKSKSLFEFQKLKEIEETQTHEIRTVFLALFESKDVRTTDAINEQFAKKCEAALKLKKAETKELLYDKSARRGIALAKTFVVIVAIISIALICVGYCNSFVNSGRVFLLYFFALTVITIFIFGFGIVFQDEKWPLWCLIGCSIFLLSRVYFSNDWNMISLDPYYIGLIAVLLAHISMFILHFKPRLSKEGAVIKGRVEGFREFIAKCEVEQIRHFCLENPNYFFDVLPYAYVFDLTEVWMDKLSQLTIDYPRWFESSENALIDHLLFSSMVTSMCRSTTSAYSRSVANFHAGSGGGGFGGGGFSGGGSGGGGFGAR